MERLDLLGDGDAMGIFCCIIVDRFILNLLIVKLSNFKLKFFMNF